MRRFAALTAVLAVSIGLAACGSSSKNSSSSDTTTTAGNASCAKNFTPVKADTLTVVTSLPGPGFWEGSDSDPTKLTSGYEYDIAKAMQQKFCMKNFVVRNESFDAIVAGTVTDYDVALSQISITPERAKVVKFSTPYFQSNQGVLIKAGSGVKVTTLDEAKKIQWGVQTGTTALDLLDQKIKPDKAAKVFQQLPDAYTALQAGQIDAVLIDTAINLGEAARSGGKFQVVAQFDQPGGPDQYGAILPKDSSNVSAVDAVLKDLSDSGQLKTLADKDLTADPGTIPVIKVS